METWVELMITVEGIALIVVGIFQRRWLRDADYRLLAATYWLFVTDAALHVGRLAHAMGYRTEASVVMAISLAVASWSAWRFATRLRATRGALRDEKEQQAAQLAESRRATKMATEMNTKFVRALAHDLREPIRGIVNFADLLLEHDLPPDKRAQLIDRVRAAARRAHDQLAELRAFTIDQNGGGDQSDPLTQQPLGQLVSDAVNALEERISEADACVELDLGADAAELYFPTALRRVVTNLVDNSLKYAGPKPHEKITTDLQDDGVQIRVTDDGPGFRAEDARRIFEPYERLAEHEKSKPGLGIGLALCREIVTQLGGEIWAVPTDDGVEGAVVTVRLQAHGPPSARRRQRR
jgi:signal transduction histidine kinase